MERTESVVVQVAPSYENDKIKEMESFGWSLQGRQEIHEEGDAQGRQSLFGDTYVVTTKVKHYVKLHFVRPLSLKNLPRIRSLETEYNALPYPNMPSLKGAIVLVIVGLLMLSAGSEVAVLGVLAIAGGGFWGYSSHKAQQTTKAALEESRSRRSRILAEVTELLE